MSKIRAFTLPSVELSACLARRSCAEIRKFGIAITRKIQNIWNGSLEVAQVVLLSTTQVGHSEARPGRPESSRSKGWSVGGSAPIYVFQEGDLSARRQSLSVFARLRPIRPARKLAGLQGKRALLTLADIQPVDSGVDRRGWQKTRTCQS
jgi:hypothetical protein